MSRIIEKRLGEELKDQVITASMIQRGVQGFYVRGVGAFFFVDVKFAVAEPPKKEPPAKPSKPGDLWDRYERDLDQPTTMFEGSRSAVIGDPQLPYNQVFWKSLGYAPMDKTKVERLKSSLFEVLAEYGRRLEALSDNERIVVLVCQSNEGSPMTLLSQSLVTQPDAGFRYGQKSDRSASALAPYTVQGGAREVFGSVLTICIERKNLVLWDDPKSLAKWARVDAYCY
jgi:hypothetical protein